MAQSSENEHIGQKGKGVSVSRLKSWGVHLSLFALTLFCATYAGAEWIFGKAFFTVQGVSVSTGPLGYSALWRGLYFSVPFIGILAVHEFGHYFTAKYYKADVSLPYFIPMWLLSPIGTLGAFIRIRSSLRSRKEIFDVGVAGPLAGFAIALGVLWYGFAHLPPPDYVLDIHPEWEKYGLDYAAHVYEDIPEGGSLQLGTNLLFEFFKAFVADPARVPNPHEIIHYPFLFAGFFACFFTALNLIPVGQLDGGHILYGLFGKKGHAVLSPVLFVAFVVYAGLGLFSLHPGMEARELDRLYWVPVYYLYLCLVFYRLSPDFRVSLAVSGGVMATQLVLGWFLPEVSGFHGWLLFALLLGRGLGLGHPAAPDDTPLDWKRRVVGWLALLVFALTFSPQPLIIE